MTAIHVGEGYIHPEHKYEYTPAELMEELENAGFDIVESLGVCDMPFSSGTGRFDSRDIIVGAGLTRSLDTAYIQYHRCRVRRAGLGSSHERGAKGRRDDRSDHWAGVAGSEVVPSSVGYSRRGSTRDGAMHPVWRRSMGIWSSLKSSLDMRQMRSRLPLVKQLRALRADHAALEGRLAEIGAKVESVHAQLDSLAPQLSAEREAMMASNDGVRRQLAFIADCLGDDLFADCLGDDLFRQRAEPVLENIRDQLDRAKSIIKVARSQYRDTMPGDANSFAPVEP
jgi:hypothetical protein